MSNSPQSNGGQGRRQLRVRSRIEEEQGAVVPGVMRRPRLRAPHTCQVTFRPQIKKGEKQYTPKSRMEEKKIHSFERD